MKLGGIVCMDSALFLFALKITIMATTVDYIAFVMDSLAQTPLRMEFHYKKMFGEYGVYANPLLLTDQNPGY